MSMSSQCTIIQPMFHDNSYNSMIKLSLIMIKHIIKEIIN